MGDQTDQLAGRAIVGFDIIAAHADRARCWACQTADCRNKRGFPGAVGTQKRQNFALLYVKVDALKSMKRIVIRFLQCINL